MKRPAKHYFWIGGLTALVLLAAAQLVPYGHQRTNPPIGSEPAWATPETRALTRRACFDCHSNETVWPPYTRVAPFSWLIQHDVDEGRAMVNFSEWQRPQEEAAESAAVVREGEMPPLLYTLMHPEARLTPEEAARLAEGLSRLALPPLEASH